MSSRLGSSKSFSSVSESSASVSGSSSSGGKFYCESVPPLLPSIDVSFALPGSPCDAFTVFGDQPYTVPKDTLGCGDWCGDQPCCWSGERLHKWSTFNLVSIKVMICGATDSAPGRIFVRPYRRTAWNLGTGAVYSAELPAGTDLSNFFLVCNLEYTYYIEPYPYGCDWPPTVNAQNLILE